MNKLVKNLVAAIMAMCIFASSSIAGYAGNVKICGGWSDDKSMVQSQHSIISLKPRVGTMEFGLPEWHLRDKQSGTVGLATVTLYSYTMELLNDTKHCKGVTSHSCYQYGFVRARFETIFGEVHKGSDTGRVFSYYGATAETPSSGAADGWNGIAHTYYGG